MNTKSSISLAAALLVGLISGWFLHGSGEPKITNKEILRSARVAASHRTGGAPHEEYDRSDTQSRRGKKSNQGSDDENEAGLLLVDPASLVALMESDVVDLERRTKLISAKEPLARLLDLSDVETAVLNNLWKQTQPKLNALRMENVKYQELADGGIWLGVEPFPEKGEELRHDFIVSTLKELGESRGKVFLDGIKAHGAFGQWGKTVGSGYAIRVRVQAEGTHLYEINEQAQADGTPGRKWQAAEIPAHLRDMAEAVGIALTP